MRIIVVSAVFPPHVQGGAEISAYNLAQWLARNGHEVAVFTTAREPSEVVSGEMIDGLKTWRVMMPRAYTAFEAPTAAGWKKPFWHAQDIFDPRNTKILGRVLDDFKPDFANVHFIQGVGYNGLNALAQRNIPTAFTLHDLGLACIKMAMFVDGQECRGLCRACAATAKIKMSYIRRVPRIGFISPSKANLDRLSALQPIGNYPRAHILNANAYPSPKTSRAPSDKLRILYVGRLSEPKGVNVLMEAIAPLSEKYEFTLDILGSGPLEAELRAKYQHLSWLHFAGHVTVDQVQDVMAASDLLVVPSIWLENSPGVVIQALGVSLPVMGSSKGGIPELVTDGETGILVTPGDVAAWSRELEGILKAPEQLETFRRNANKRAGEFDQDYLGRKVVSFFEEIMAYKGQGLAATG